MCSARWSQLTKEAILVVIDEALKPLIDITAPLSSLKLQREVVLLRPAPKGHSGGVCVQLFAAVDIAVDVEAGVDVAAHVVVVAEVEDGALQGDGVEGGH